MKTPSTILVVDDEPDMLRYLRTLLEVDSYEVETAASGVEALERIQKSPGPDLVLLDLLMPELDGLQTLERVHRIRPEQKVVMLSCVSEPGKVVKAMKLGALDYLVKPFQKAELDVVVKHHLSSGQMISRLDQLASDDKAMEELGGDLTFVAASAAMRKIHSQVTQLANVDLPVLMLGESGTGKEVVSRLIHKLSSRANRMFLKVNCAALPGELLESELFGYEPGAFTGAVRPKPGKFELCNRGTILLDEIAEMTPGLQAKLLHVLQDQQFSRLGSRSIVRVDVRILAATNVDIPKAIESKRFREDLYYRLNAFTIHVPPLRERREEIPILLRHFMSRFAAKYARPPLPLSATLIETATRYRWPGNLRELENFVKRYLILGEESMALSELGLKEQEGCEAGEKEAESSGTRSGDLKALVRNLKDQAEMEAIRRVLDQTNWNRKEASRILNISYKALLYKIRQYGIGQ